FASDADHFIYCAEGSTVEIDVLAKFIGGTDCDDCDHGPRTYTWSVSGATSYTINSQTDGPHKSFISVELAEAGDTISIECEVSSISQGECYEDRHGEMGEHGGSHAGDTASCTIKLWRVDMEVTGANAVG